MTGKTDICIFGATGFTGQRVAFFLARKLQKSTLSLTWSLAGRSSTKLSELADRITEECQSVCRPECVIADVSQPETLDSMAKSTRILINCVGPYRFYGTPVVAACVNNSTHYLDVSGEPAFMESVLFDFDVAAKESSTLIVSAAGFDSIPADIGVQYFKTFYSDVKDISVESYLSLWSTTGFKAHYTTWESAVHGFANAGELSTLRKKAKALGKTRKGGPSPKKRGIHRWRGLWAVPFPGSDASVVRRTQEQLPNPVTYGAYFVVNDTLSLVVLFFYGMLFYILTRLSVGVNLLLKYPEFFSNGVFSHTGPTEKEMSGTQFTMTFCATSLKNDKVEKKDEEMKFLGPEPGYVATPIFVIDCALLLAQNGPKCFGVKTPGLAFDAKELIGELEKDGITIEGVRIK